MKSKAKKIKKQRCSARTYKSSPKHCKNSPQSDGRCKLHQRKIAAGYQPKQERKSKSFCSVLISKPTRCKILFPETPNRRFCFIHSSLDAENEGKKEKEKEQEKDSETKTKEIKKKKKKKIEEKTEQKQLSIQELKKIKRVQKGRALYGDVVVDRSDDNNDDNEKEEVIAVPKQNDNNNNNNNNNNDNNRFRQRKNKLLRPLKRIETSFDQSLNDKSSDEEKTPPIIANQNLRIDVIKLLQENPNVVDFWQNDKWVDFVRNTTKMLQFSYAVQDFLSRILNMDIEKILSFEMSSKILKDLIKETAPTQSVTVPYSLDYLNENDEWWTEFNKFASRQKTRIISSKQKQWKWKDKSWRTELIINLTKAFVQTTHSINFDSWFICQKIVYPSISDLFNTQIIKSILGISYYDDFQTKTKKRIFFFGEIHEKLQKFYPSQDEVLWMPWFFAILRNAPNTIFHLFMEVPYLKKNLGFACPPPEQSRGWCSGWTLERKARDTVRFAPLLQISLTLQECFTLEKNKCTTPNLYTHYSDPRETTQKRESLLPFLTQYLHLIHKQHPALVTSLDLEELKQKRRNAHLSININSNELWIFVYFEISQNPLYVKAWNKLKKVKKELLKEGIQLQKTFEKFFDAVAKEAGKEETRFRSDDDAVTIQDLEENSISNVNIRKRVTENLWIIVNFYMDILFLMRLMYYIVVGKSSVFFGLTGRNHTQLYAKVFANVYNLDYVQTIRNEETGDENRLETQNLKIISFLRRFIESF